MNMKLHTKIISLLLVAGLASAGAQSTGSSASDYYVKGSFGIADPQEKGLLESLGGKKLGALRPTPLK